jgi:uncharacterized protein (UPF0248 family)
MVFQTLNRLKWSGRLKSCRIVILHRGAKDNKKVVEGSLVTEIKRSYFLYREKGRETFIPNRRVLEIRVNGRAVWKR